MDISLTVKDLLLLVSLKGLTENQVQALIEERGGNITSSVSKKTDFILVGKDAGSKYEKAKDLGITMLDENTFQKML